SIERKSDVGILVVDKRAKHARRQVAGFVAQFLARLVELLGDVGRRCAVLEGQGHEGEPRPRHRLDAVVPAQLLHPLLERLGDEILHLLRSGARPRRRDGQHLDRERGILGAAEPEERIGAGNGNDDDEEQSDGALAHRQRGEVETAHCAAPRSSTRRTRSPWWRRWAPSATTRSPGSTPLTTAISLASRRTCTALNKTDEEWGSTTQTPLDLPSS